MSGVWLYIAAVELICILRVRPPVSPRTPAYNSLFAWMEHLFHLSDVVVQALGRIYGVSEEMIGLSAIAWGNTVVDLVANVMVAKRAFATMAFSACFGAPTFSKFPCWVAKEHQ